MDGIVTLDVEAGHDLVGKFGRRFTQVLPKRSPSASMARSSLSRRSVSSASPKSSHCTDTSMGTRLVTRTCTADQGFLHLEFGGEAGLAGGVIQRIPLVGAEGPVRHDCYAFYPAQNANPLAGEFADILADLFAG